MAGDAHTFRIKTGFFHTMVEMDGEELKGVASVSIQINPNSPSTITLKIYGDIEVEGKMDMVRHILSMSRPEE